MKLNEDECIKFIKQKTLQKEEEILEAFLNNGEVNSELKAFIVDLDQEILVDF